MITRFQHSRQIVGQLLSLAACGLPLCTEAAQPAQVGNPIGRIARIFDPQLVKVEDRVTWLDQQISTYAKHCEYPLKVGLGFRGCRSAPGAPDPSITLDLGREVPIESIFLVPAQREFLEDTGIFPKRFTLELSQRADFGQRTILYTSGAIPLPPPDGNPIAFHSKDTARFVRLTIQEGHNKGALDLFGLSELMVISKGEPVSFQADVETVGALDATSIWYPKALIDGRTPLGIWQNGSMPDLNPGDAVSVVKDETTTWKIELDSAQPIDRIILFPFRINRSFEASVFPESLEVRIDSDSSSNGAVYEWSNTIPGSSHMTPLVIPLRGQSAKSISIIATSPWIMGDKRLHALSEIEVWSQGDQYCQESSGRTDPSGPERHSRQSERRIHLRKPDHTRGSVDAAASRAGSGGERTRITPLGAPATRIPK